MTIARNELIGKGKTKYICLWCSLHRKQSYLLGAEVCHLHFCLVVFLTNSPFMSFMCLLPGVGICRTKVSKMVHALHIAIMFPCVSVCVLLILPQLIHVLSCLPTLSPQVHLSQVPSLCSILIFAFLLFHGHGSTWIYLVILSVSDSSLSISPKLAIIKECKNQGPKY